MVNYNSGLSANDCKLIMLMHVCANYKSLQILIIYTYSSLLRSRYKGRHATLLSSH